MIKKGTSGRILAIVCVLVICGIVIAAGSGWANTYKGSGKSYKYNQGSQHHYVECGDCGGGCSYNQGSQHHYTERNRCGKDCGCQPEFYVYYSTSDKCGKFGSCTSIDIPERPSCDSTPCPPANPVNINVPAPPTTVPVGPPDAVPVANKYGQSMPTPPGFQ